MELYRVKLKLLSPLCTPLKGDTIWGHVVWGIAHHEGSDAVISFLEQEKCWEPAFVVSSAYPHGLVPKPILPDKAFEKITGRDDYAKIKRMKKQRFVKSPFTKIDSDLTQMASLESPFTLESRLRNTIDRSSLSVLEGGLYSNTLFWPRRDGAKQDTPVFDLYVASSYSADRIGQLLGWAFENGFGADSSTGMGVVKILGEPESISCDIEPGARCMALGPFVSDAEHPIEDLLADIHIRRGKIGGSFSSELSPYKKTVILYDEGATFIQHTSSKIVGRLIMNVHSDDRICQSGFAPIIPVPKEDC